MSNGLYPTRPDEGGATETQDAPLTEQERKLVSRLLSDPTYFPVEYRTWLKTYLEGSGMQLPSSSIVGGKAGKRTALPPGIILPFAGGSIPPDTKICNGDLVKRVDFKDLFAAIGTTWGAGDGTSTFALPDLRDRALYGAGNAVGLGATDGADSSGRGGPRHHHYFQSSTDEQGQHAHGIGGSTDWRGDHVHGTDGAFAIGTYGTFNHGTGGQTRYTVQDFRLDTHSNGGHQHDFGGGTDEQGQHGHWVDGDTSGGYGLDAPSYAGVNYLITTG